MRLQSPYEWEPAERKKWAKRIVTATLFGWPLTSVVIWWLYSLDSTGVGQQIATQLLLALSWLAITLTGVDIVMTTDVRKEQEERDSG